MSVKKKKIDFSVRPRASPDLPTDPDQWVREGRGEAATAQPADEGPLKRLTLNLPAKLHTAFKGRCVLEDISIQDKVRLLIERELASSQPQPGEGAPP